MPNKKLTIQSVPTNIITGFLGVGKTSAILNLLRNKADNERWAVLVNEFGEIGVDGSLLTSKPEQNQSNAEQGLFISEVPGGCMCCAAGVPMQIALNQLLLKAKPDRLLIEPTGLGHPQEVLNVLNSEHYQDALLLQKTLTLVDARNLYDERYTNHDTFNQQIAIADVVIGNKADLYQAGDKVRLRDYVSEKGKENVSVKFTEYGDITLELLKGKSLDSSQSTCCSHHEHKHEHNHAHSHEEKHEHSSAHSHSHSHDHHDRIKVLAADLPLPECGYLKAENSGEGFQSIGWRFAEDKVFNYQKITDFITSVISKENTQRIERIKAVFNTEQGRYTFNIAPDSLFKQNKVNQVVGEHIAPYSGMQDERSLNTNESRIEIIATQLPVDLESSLLECLSINAV